MEWSALMGWMSRSFHIVDKMVVTEIGHLLLRSTDSLQKYEEQLKMS